MIKSQNQKLKLLILFLICFVTISFTGLSNAPKGKLLLADSLFQQKKYTQSFELYEDIYTNDQKASSAMLLKMAFIKEGLGDFTNALYYLNVYYLKSYDKRALKKMENLAEQNKLSGYNYDDVEFFLNLYHQYQLQIDLILLSLALLVFGVLSYQKRSNKQISRSSGISYVGLLVVLLFINNFARERPQAIITTAEVYLMKGPSPGSDVVDKVTKGHRVDILGHDDVWVKISWNDQDAYIKSFDLKPVTL